MDARELFLKLEQSFAGKVKEPEFKVLSDHGADGVECLVISTSFEKMKRHERMEFMTGHLEKALGSEFYNAVYVGSALTKAEFARLLADLEAAQDGSGEIPPHSAKQPSL